MENNKIRKYELVKSDKITLKDRDIYRVSSLINFTTVDGEKIHSGDLGGYIQSEHNLSHEGNAWAAGNSMVLGDAHVYGNALVRDFAVVDESAKVYGNVIIRDYALIAGNTEIYDNVEVSGITRNDIIITDSGNSRIFDNTQV